MTDKKTAPAPKIAERKKPFLLFFLGLILLGLLGYTLYESERLEQANKARIAAAQKPKMSAKPLVGAPAAKISEPEIITAVKPTTPKIVDVTRSVKSFPTRVVKPYIANSVSYSFNPVEKIVADAKKIKKRIQTTEVVSPPHLPGEIKGRNLAGTAEVLQATLALAKLQGVRQAQLAELHTLMGLLQNTTQRTEEKQDWAKLALRVSRALKADDLATALNAYVAPVVENTDSMAPVEGDIEASGLPAFLAPFQNLITVRRIDDQRDKAASKNDLKAVLMAYRIFLTKESE